MGLEHREPQPMGSKHKKLKSIGPLPRKLQPNDISLFESWGIAFFEALFILVYDNFLLKTRFRRTLYPTTLRREYLLAEAI